jgi:hypothetical protein
MVYQLDPDPSVFTKSGHYMGQNDWTPVLMVSDPKDDHAICQMPNGCPKENGPIGRYALFMVFVWAILR